MISLIQDMMGELRAKDKDGIIATVQELKRNQFGMPLAHYAQQYLFGSTGLRIRVFYSIAGPAASCKSTLLMDLMGHICATEDNGGLDGIGFLYELEDKISPTLLAAVMGSHGIVPEHDTQFAVVHDQTLQGAFGHLMTKIIPAYKEKVKTMSVPMVVGIDSIGGAASDDTVEKIKSEGAVGKGHHDKPHIMKYFCENATQIMDKIPMIVICVNQEKEAIATTTYGGPPPKKITGGLSQVFKDGHMLSASAKTLASGDGNIVRLKTTKASFCDKREIEVGFRWNRHGDLKADMYGHHFEWAMASAKCIADPSNGVGDIRDIANVSISKEGRVTCPQLNCKSVQPEEFEQALMSEEFRKVREDLYAYQKIEQIHDIREYAQWLKTGKLEAAPKPEKPAKAKARPKKAEQTPDTVDFDAEVPDEQ